MTPGQLTLAAYDERRKSASFHTRSKIAPSRRQMRDLERAAVDCSEHFEALRSAATQGGYHNVECR